MKIQPLNNPQPLSDSEHDARWMSLVRPERWENPVPRGRYNLVVIGGGPAGLVAAIGAAGLGAKVALVERYALGGDCLNHGCVPSKALLHSARSHKIAKSSRANREYFRDAMERMRRLRAELAVHDSAERLKSLGVDIFFGDAKFTGRDTVLTGEHNLGFHRALIATGSRPAIPAISGLGETGYFTNETVFSIDELPRRLLVVGGGPVGCELGQAFARFGSEVTLVQTHGQLLPRDEADAASLVQASLERDGVRVRLNAGVSELRKGKQGVVAAIESGHASESVTVDAVLIATGRKPNVESLNLKDAGVDFSVTTGVKVNDRLQTTNPRVFAAGDVCGRDKFTHAADEHARIVLRNALFGFVPFRPRVSRLVVPWCTYTSPQVAGVGSRSGADDVVRVDLKDVDRAVLDDGAEGFLKIHLRRGTGRIVGATAVAEHAGEMIGPIVLAMTREIGLGDLGAMVAPYPTLTGAIRKAADEHRRKSLTPRIRGLMETLMRWRR